MSGLDKFNAETLSREMFQAVDANHRRAVMRAKKALDAQEEPRRKEMPMWACVTWTVVLGLLWVACMVYALVG